MDGHDYLNDPNRLVWQEMGWHPTKQQLEQFSALQKLLIHWNKQVNLTRLLKGHDYWISQVFDSLWPLKNELTTPNQARNCIDIGTGCGFPGLAVAIALPGAKVTLVDSLNKKTAAITKITHELGLSSRVAIYTERAEVTGRKPISRANFDLAMARAVAIAPVVAEYLVPLINRDGEVLIFRGHWSELDQQKLTKALIPLQASLIKVDRQTLPNNRGERHVLRIKAKGTCPKFYPRSVGIPSKKPLGG